jgi:hypothetical protein
MLPNLMLRLARLLLGVVRSLFLRRADLLLENLALRQQLAVLVHSGRRPRIGGADRIFWMILSRWWSRWSDTLAFVKPETVVQWHRTGFPSIGLGSRDVLGKGDRPSVVT